MSDLLAALAELQANPPKIRKRATGQIQSRTYKYATLDAIWSALEEWRQKHGIIWVCCPTVIANREMTPTPVLTYRLVQVESGDELNGHYPLTDAHGQALGADITYARRYALCAVLGLLADEDTDGRPLAPRERSRARIDPEHERLANSIQRQQPGDRPAERVTGGQTAVDMWMDNPPGEFEIGTPEDRPGTIDRDQERAMHREFNRLNITDRAVRLGMTQDIIGRQIMTSKQLSRLEADHLIKTLKARQEGQSDG